VDVEFHVANISCRELGVEVCSTLIGFNDGLERWCNLLEEQSAPVDRSKEGVLLELGSVVSSTKTMFRIPIEKLCKCIYSR